MARMPRLIFLSSVVILIYVFWALVVRPLTYDGLVINDSFVSCWVRWTPSSNPTSHFKLNLILVARY